MNFGTMSKLSRTLARRALLPFPTLLLARCASSESLSPNFCAARR